MTDIVPMNSPPPPMHSPSTARYVSLAALLAVIVAFGLLFYRVMAGFLLPLFIAALLAVLFHPVHVRLRTWCRDRNTLAAGLTTSLILMIVLLPLIGIIGLAVFEAQQMLGSLPKQKDRIDQRLGEMRDAYGLSMPFAPQLQAIQKGFQDIHDRDDSHKITSPNATPEADMFQHVKLLDQRLQDEEARIQGIVQSQPAPPSGWSAWGEPRNLAKLIDPAISQDPSTTWEHSEAYRVVRLLAEPDHLQQLKEDLAALSERCHTMMNAVGQEQNRDYRVALVEAEARFQSIQAILFGGSIRGPLVQLGNPSKSQIDSWIVLGRDRMQEWLPSITGQATSMMVNLLVGISIMSIAMFYFLADGSSMILAIMHLSPLDDRYEAELLREFDTVSRAVVLATLLSAIAQGVLAGIGYYVAGVDKTILLTLMTAVLALVPFVGASVVWVPVCLWLVLVEQRTFAGAALAIYCATIVSTIDNVVKPYILHGQSRLHPLLALLSVLGGVESLGPIGLIVGPMVVSFLQALLIMLRSELAELGSEGSVPATVPTSDATQLTAGSPSHEPSAQPPSGDAPPTGPAAPST